MGVGRTVSESGY